MFQLLTLLPVLLSPTAWGDEVEFALPSAGTPHLDGAVGTPRYGGALVAHGAFDVTGRRGRLGILGVVRPGSVVEFGVGIPDMSYDAESGSAPVFSPGPLVFAARCAEIPAVPDTALLVVASLRPARLPAFDEPMRLSARVAYGHDFGPVRPLVNLGVTGAARADIFGGVGAAAHLPWQLEASTEVVGRSDGQVLAGGSLGANVRGDGHVALAAWHARGGGPAESTVMLRFQARYMSKGMALPQRSDRDGDGVVDVDDDCPSRWGTREDGCYLPPCDCGLDTMSDGELRALGQRLASPPAGVAYVFQLGVVANGDPDRDWLRTERALKAAKVVLEHYVGYQVMLMAVEPSAAGQVEFISLPYGSVTSYIKKFAYRGPQ